MAQESISNKRIAIVGAGACGCVCAKFLQDLGLDVTLFDKGKFLRTILPTGGGRCNLAHNEQDFKQLAQNYPRGEKFLYSIFSKFSTEQTLDFFQSIGIKTYIQDDNRIFPTTNSSEDVRDKILKSINKCEFVSEKIVKIEKTPDCFKLLTTKGTWAFDYVIVTIGGHSDFDFIKDLGINIIPPTQALVGLVTKEDVSELAGVSLKKVTARIEKKTYSGDIIFTHKGISGPLIYKISSIYARKVFPYKLQLNLWQNGELQDLLNNNPHKEIKNILKPKSLANYILKTLKINPETPCHKINSKIRDSIISKFQNFEINICSKVPDGETVTCGGVDLKEINSKTLECKKIPGLYFGGEVLDIDGFCGGFNLQNCWSCAYIIANAIKKDICID